MHGHENLIPLNQRSKEDQRKIQEMGRKANKEKYQIKRNVREALLLLRDVELDNEKLKKRIEETTPLKGKEVTNAIALAYMAMQYTLKGNPSWARLLFEMMGENDVQGVQKCQPNIEVVFSDKVEKNESTVSDGV